MTIEPRQPFSQAVTMGSRARIQHHHVKSPRWAGPALSVAVLSDMHVCRPWVTLGSLARIVEKTNALGADLILLGGDFIPSRQMPGLREEVPAIARTLARLAAPLGVHAVLGNHDWWDCSTARATDFTENAIGPALVDAGISLLTNQSKALSHGDSDFWLVGMDSQWALRSLRAPGFHDPEAAFAEVPSDAPAILLAHEPDYFSEGDHRAFLQISGHTHGGQMNLGGWRPLTPSHYGGRYAWGHVHEEGRHLVVSGGIGYSGLPLRVFQPPEITLVTVSPT